MKYESGYPTPDENSDAITIDGKEYEPGDQFRFVKGSDGAQLEKKYELCYVLQTSGDSVTFFNVTEEMEVILSKRELADTELHKLNKKWGEAKDS